jgi:LuxR family transcriptional regulator, maltose regulon positive regulatory protein
MSARGVARPKGQATSGDDPVLTTKITIPGLPGWVVPRPRIEKLIAEGARGPLTTVTGPPGAGKTMAIALWAAACASADRLAWITLDDYDNRPKVFWSYFVAALRRAGVAVPRISPAAAAGDAVDHLFLLRLASVLAAQDPPVVVVLDDLHLLTEPGILDGLGYVLRNARPGLRLVVSSRMDPLLPLHRYRLTGELAEIRAGDLAFSVAESGLLLAQHGITLPDAALECLTRRAEGWAAGMRLAAMSMDGLSDPEQFVKELDAEGSAIASYLVDEVLDAQPSATRELLLRTSILDQVNAGIAAELADDEQVTNALPALAQANAFVRPVGHGWYRYHSLFNAVLRLKLRRERPGLVLDLHRRAALWFSRNGSLTQAVRHAGESGDWQLAAGIALDELAVGQLIEPRGSQPLADGFRRMPRCMSWMKPQPLLVAAALDLSDAEGLPSAASLDAAETLIEHLPADDEIPVRLATALIRLALSRRTGDLGAATTAAVSAERLLAAIPESLVIRHPAIRAQVLSGRGAVEFWAGHLDEAAASFTAGAAAASAPDSTHERADCLGNLALVAALGGRLSRAAKLADEAAGAAENNTAEPAEPVGSAASVALAWVHLERNEPQQARAQLKLADAALRIRPDRLMNAAACLVAARCSLASGRPGVAAEMVSGARRGWPLPVWLEHRLAIVEARACAAVGDIESAIDTATRADPHSHFDAAITLAQALLAAGDPQAARHLLAAGPAVPAGQPDYIRLEASLVDARLSYESGDRARGRRALEQALKLGHPEQIRLPFVMERTWIRPVLRLDPDLIHAYRHLLGPDLVSTDWVPPRPRAGDGAPLIVERLSDREREVLQHLSGMLSTAEIATEMYISVNTVKTHLKSIYRKLAAAHRSEAVRRARLLELI